MDSKHIMQRVLLVMLLTAQSALALQNWVAKTDPAENDFSDMNNWSSLTDTDIQFNVPLWSPAPELWMGMDATFGRLVLGATNLVFNLGNDRILMLGAT